MIGIILLIISATIILTVAVGSLCYVGVNVIKNGDSWWQKLIGIFLILVSVTLLTGYILGILGV